MMKNKNYKPGTVVYLESFPVIGTAAIAVVFKEEPWLELVKRADPDLADEYVNSLLPVSRLATLRILGTRIAPPRIMTLGSEKDKNFPEYNVEYVVKYALVSKLSLNVIPDIASFLQMLKTISCFKEDLKGSTYFEEVVEELKVLDAVIKGKRIKKDQGEFINEMKLLFRKGIM
jgi:hypothetical protein